MVFGVKASTSSTSVTEYMRIQSGGNVGIGTSSPATQLEIMSTTGGTLRLKRDDTTITNDEILGTLEFYTNDGDGPHVASYVRGLGADPSNFGRYGALSFGVSKTANTDAVEAMRINLSGDVGIGTTTPTTKLQVMGSGNVVTIYSDNNTLSLGLGYQGTIHGYLGGFSSRLEAYSNNGGYVYLSSSSTWIPASDIKRKRNFETYSLGLNAILGLKPKLYNMDFQKDGDDKQLGLVAQEVREFIPLAYEQSEDFIGLNYNSIIVTMVNAIQELKAEIDNLKNK